MMKITRLTNTKTSVPVRVSPNLVRKIKAIKIDVQSEFKKKHDIVPKISDTMATRILGMFLDGDHIVKITHKRKSINLRLKR